MAGYEKAKEELDALGATVIAASADAEDKAGEVAGEVSFPVGFGVTPAEAEAIGAWWSETRGGIVQPAEFLLGPDRTVASSTYSSGPIGRMDAADVIALVKFRESRR